MILTMNVNENDVRFHLEKPAHTEWIVATYFKEFCVNVAASGLEGEANLDKIKSSLNEAFQSFATYSSYQRTETVYKLSFRYKETVGIPYEEIFEEMMRIQANWLIDTLSKIDVCQTIPYQIEITLDYVYPYSSIIKNIEN